MFVALHTRWTGRSPAPRGTARRPTRGGTAAAWEATTPTGAREPSGTRCPRGARRPGSCADRCTKDRIRGACTRTPPPAPSRSRRTGAARTRARACRRRGSPRALRGRTGGPAPRPPRTQRGTSAGARPAPGTAGPPLARPGRTRTSLSRTRGRSTPDVLPPRTSAWNVTPPGCTPFHRRAAASNVGWTRRPPVPSLRSGAASRRSSGR
jgi:hypothetical protein